MTGADDILGALTARGQTLAVAESLTGGLLAARITDVPGASRAFRGSVTAYATDVKRDVLGVDGGLLAERGAVDADVAAAMAEGVRAALRADWGVATTGVAGPEPQDGQPVGTVYVAVSGPEPTDGAVCALSLEGGRGQVREAAVREALRLLDERLAGVAKGTDGAKSTEHRGGKGCLQP